MTGRAQKASNKKLKISNDAPVVKKINVSANMRRISNQMNEMSDICKKTVEPKNKILG